MGHNELLIAEALRGVPREEYLLSVKFGALRAPDNTWLGVDARPAAVKNSLAHPICDLQIEYSLVSRGIEDAILPTCRELGIAITAYGVLSRGLIGGHFSADRQLDPGDFRAHAPRFSEQNRERNLELVEDLRGIADSIGASVAQVAIAWMLARGQDIVPLIGARTPERLAEALGALDVKLGDDDRAALERAVPLEGVAGDRYPEPQMATLDSERT
jgi:aryl-alcohol dehydrogenase-like predicted oxidoreductase